MMKKTTWLLMLVMLTFLLVPEVWAKNGVSTGNGGAGMQTGATTAPAKVTPVMNQNQVKTQNAGEEQQLTVQTEEQEETKV